MLGSWRSSVAVLASCALTAPALAQPPAAPALAPTKNRRAANDLVKKANQRVDAADYAGAIEFYKQAYAIVPDAGLLPNIGSAYQKLGKREDALQYFCKYLHDESTGDAAAFARSQARALQIQLGNAHVDDRDVCAPARPEAVAPPAHVESPIVKPADPVAAPAPAAPPEHTWGTLAYVGLATAVVGVAALGVGTYDGVQARDISNRIDDHKVGDPWPADIQDLQHRGQSYEDQQIGFLISGGVLLTAGAVLFVIGRTSGPAARPSETVLRVSPTSNGFVVAGKF
jgi:tetratricopeptide (TPR) repeat protein